MIYITRWVKHLGARKNDEGVDFMNIPLSEKYTLTVLEAVDYFGIGETKLRQIIRNNPTASYILWNGNKALIKRKLFEKEIDGMSVI